MSDVVRVALRKRLAETEMMMETDRLLECAEQLKQLHTLGDGVVIRFTKTYLDIECAREFTYAAIKVNNRWFITGYGIHPKHIGSLGSTMQHSLSHDELIVLLLTAGTMTMSVEILGTVSTIVVIPS